MTHNEFNQIRQTATGLPPEQMRQLRDELDRKLAESAVAKPSGKSAKRTKADPKAAAKPMTRAEFDQYLLEIGLLSQLPDTEADFDDPDDQLVEIKGEPLSETIIRERR